MLNQPNLSNYISKTKVLQVNAMHCKHCCEEQRHWSSAKYHNIMRHDSLKIMLLDSTTEGRPRMQLSTSLMGRTFEKAMHHQKIEVLDGQRQSACHTDIAIFNYQVLFRFPKIECQNLTYVYNIKLLIRIAYYRQNMFKCNLKFHWFHSNLISDTGR